jgi:hypothetical protein
MKNLIFFYDLKTVPMPLTVLYTLAHLAALGIAVNEMVAGPYAMTLKGVFSGMLYWGVGVIVAALCYQFLVEATKKIQSRSSKKGTVAEETVTVSS